MMIAGMTHATRANVTPCPSQYMIEWPRGPAKGNVADLTLTSPTPGFQEATHLTLNHP